MSSENFFDFREKMSARATGGTPAPSEPLTVTQLTARIERAIKSGVPGTVHVKGEVSNFNLHRSSGHLYFTLKDSGACIDCVMFRSEAARLKFDPADGMEMLAAGRVAVYPQRGRYQLYVTSLIPLGQGALELAFRQLCEKLEREGLFDPRRRKPLPRFPTRIALITSQSTAALQDILKVLRRFGWLKLMLYHVPVQGDGSAELIADAIRSINRHAAALGGVDVMILGRGGGSLEDLWEFNEEVVARAMVASRIPIVTGIGHEVDTSIADLVADYHAHTPTEAAQVVTSHWRIVLELVQTASLRLRRGLSVVVSDSRHRLLSIRRHEFFRRPTDRINQLRQLLDDQQRQLALRTMRRLKRAEEALVPLETLLTKCHPMHELRRRRDRLAWLEAELHRSARASLKRMAQRIDSTQRTLDALSPQQVLKRGFSLTLLKKSGKPVQSESQVRAGDVLVTRLADGEIESVVEDRRQGRLFE